MKYFSILSAASLVLAAAEPVVAVDLTDEIAADYDSHLAELWDHFHRNPELSLMESNTAARLAEELRSIGYDVTEGVGAPVLSPFWKTVTLFSVQQEGGLIANNSERGVISLLLVQS